ncbi:ATP-binding protein [Maridesulfovibrio sp.]|uniref:sensor histidine kinase n=1 Tax=Maridesulfovibrio sp. TaxID=2795000 RepID=UPI0029CA6295|nr:ATP-binding protein [Maridesulfovibrio sp.]
MKRLMDRGVHKLLLITMIVVPAIPLLLAVLIGYYSYSTTTEKLVVSAIRQSAIDHRDIISAFLKERQADLQAYLNLIPPDHLKRGLEHDDIALMFKSAGGVFQDLGLISPNGVQMSYAGAYELIEKKYLGAPWYQDAVKNGYHVSDVFLGYRNVPHFVVAVTRLIDGKPWVLRGTINPDIFRKLVDGVKLGDTGEAYIVSLDGKFQTVRRSGGRLLENDFFKYPKQEKNIITFLGNDHGVDYLFASALMNDGKWRLIVRQKRADAFRSTNYAGYTILIILFCGGVVIVVLAFFASRKICETLERQAGAVCALENQLMRAARLAELGEMSAGFAHEINNPLQIMKSDLALLEMVLKDALSSDFDPIIGDEVQDIADQLKLQIDRCAGITREILNFGRSSKPELQNINLEVYLPGVGAMVEKKATVHGIQLSCAVSPDTPSVEADPRQLQQVMVNLLNNAIQAVIDRHGSKGGKVSVEAMRGEDGSAIIKVTDNGTGISSDNLTKVFVPFFSTKAPGKGTGLGLSVCHTIIDTLGGELTVESVRNEGSVFTIILPGINC